MNKVLVLGSTGMLGSAVAQMLSNNKNELLTTSRYGNNSSNFNAGLDSIEDILFLFPRIKIEKNC